MQLSRCRYRFRHNLVAMRVQIKLKKIKKCVGRKRWDVTKLKTNEVAFRKGVEEHLEYEAGMSVEKKWKKIKETILESALTHVGYTKGRESKKPWITSGMMSKMREKRKLKSK